MSHVPEFYPNISLKLVSVLEEIGVNERMILKRRRTMLLYQTLRNILNVLGGLNVSCHYFGSQVEGTTTQGLCSDTDNLICNHGQIVIQDLGEWEPGLTNLLMIQEETTPPGYCMLQRLCSDVPTAVTKVQNEHHVRYRGNKVLLKNTFMDNFHKIYGHSKHGPAGTRKDKGICDQDYVHAFPFKTLPEFLNTWLQRQTEQGNLSEDMKRYIEYSPCYVVPVGRKDSPFEEVQWRISTSHAERCLMFNLNITQIHCYILMKLILKTYLKHPLEKALSTFMCKNILLLCIAKTHHSKWSPHNLLSVFRYCLHELKRSVQLEHCPHFIMKENNLMAKKFTPEVKSWLLEKIQYIYERQGCAFFGVQIDDIGRRLQFRLNILSHIRDIQVDQSAGISGLLLYELANMVSGNYNVLLRSIQLGKNSFNDIITTLVQLNYQGSDLEQSASCLLTPLICSSLGSVIASTDIHQDHSVSPEALTWLSLGLNSDVASSRLKLASVYYCVGDFNTTETILSNIAKTYDQSIVEAVCTCYYQVGFSGLERFKVYANSHDEYSIRHIVALCVRFLPDEVNCQPRELQYEMFRSTQEDRAHRDEQIDSWMDWAVADSLPFLYFLQYKTYGQLQKGAERQQAMNNLVRSIYTTRNLRHKETALNLLGQCYQQENRHTEALQCYMNSLNVRPTNNAAKLHICLLLYAIYSGRPPNDKIVSNSQTFLFMLFFVCLLLSFLLGHFSV